MTALFPSEDAGVTFAVAPPPAPTRPPPRPGLPRRVGGPPRTGCDQRRPKESGMHVVQRPPSAPQHQTGARPSNPDREAIIARIEMLWHHHNVPSWHRALYAVRYFKAGGCRREALFEEANALARGSASVLDAMRAVEDREVVLTQLENLRNMHKDDDFQEGAAPTNTFIELLLRLRSTSVVAVEAVSSWRRSVAPLHCANSSVVGPGARGACWPHGPRQEDYLWIVAHRDTVVRSFAGVLDLPPMSDPFLLQCSLPANAGAAPAKLQLPAPHGRLAERMEAAKLLLLEEEIAGVVLSAGAPAEADVPIDASLPPMGFMLASPETGSILHHHAEKTSSGKSVLPTLWPNWPQRPQSARDSRVAIHHVEQRISHSVLMDQLNQLNSEVLSNPGSILRPRSARSSKRGKKRSAGGCKDTDHCIPGFTPQDQVERQMKQVAAGLSKSRTGIGSDLTPPKKSTSAREQTRRTSRLNNDETKEDDATLWQEAGEQEGPEYEKRLSVESGDSIKALRDGSQMFQTDHPLVSRVVLSNLWKKYSHDQTLHRDDIPKLLETAGLLHVSSTEGLEWIEEIFQGITRYNSIEHEDFWIFIQKYEQRQRDTWNKSFAEFDSDQSGNISCSEFADLIQSLGIEPMMDVLREVILEVDADGTGDLDLREFYDVMKLLREREGFSRHEHDNFMEIHDLFDRDKSGSIVTSDLHPLLTYLGFSIDPCSANAISREVDVDGSGTLDKHEFLVCMRKVRDREVKTLKQVMVQFADNDGSIDPGRVHCLLNTLGYIVDDDVMVEVADTVGLDLHEDLHLGGLWNFLLRFRDCEGLSQEESEAVDNAYARYTGKDHTGECLGDVMRTTEVGKVLRYMGYAMTFEEQQILTMQVDVSEQGYLQKCGVKKMIRMVRDQEVKEAQDGFRKVAGFASSGLLVSAVSDAFRMVGCVQPDGSIPRISREHVEPNGLTISEETFLRIVRRQNKENRRIFRENGGFSLQDLDDLRRRFGEYDRDGSGDITQGELITLIEAIFPRMSHEVRLRPRLLDIMKEVDQGGKGTLEFHDFLRLMRICRDQQDREALSKERRAVDETKFSPAEVHEFRDLFIQTPGLRDGELPIPEVIRMVSSICKLGEKNTFELKDKLGQMQASEGKGQMSPYGRVNSVDTKGGSQGGLTDPQNPANWIDFADFLWLMRWILNTNFGDVKQQTEGAAYRYKSSFADQQRRNAKLVTTGQRSSRGTGDYSFFRQGNRGSFNIEAFIGQGHESRTSSKRRSSSKKTVAHPMPVVVPGASNDALGNMENVMTPAGSTSTLTTPEKAAPKKRTDRRQSMAATLSPRSLDAPTESSSRRQSLVSVSLAASKRGSRRVSKAGTWNSEPSSAVRGSLVAAALDKHVLALKQKFYSDQGLQVHRESDADAGGHSRRGSLQVAIPAMNPRTLPMHCTTQPVLSISEDMTEP